MSMEGNLKSIVRSYVPKCRSMAKQMVRLESVGPGDTDNAMLRLATRHGLPYRLFWNLRFRPPKSIDFGMVVKLALAYRAECERHAKGLMRQVEDIEDGGVDDNAFIETIVVAARVAATSAYEGELAAA